MVVFLFILFCVALCLAAWYLWPHEITAKEIAVLIAINSVALCSFWFGSTYIKGSDFLILNGKVQSKTSEKVSCEHSYQCNCTRSCSKDGCSETCQTCYEHLYDVDWVVRTTVGNLEIDRVDRQGITMPPRFKSVIIGEPASVESSYYNYIKAAPFSIFNKTALESKISIPGYPRVYDYYRIKRVIQLTSLGANSKEIISKINDRINERLKVLGSKKKVNVIVIFHKNDSNWVEVLKAKYYGGKINDVIIAIEVKENNIVDVESFSWSKNDLVNVKIRDDILEKFTTLNQENTDQFVETIMTNIDKHFVKRSSDEFEYLSKEIRPDDWVVYFCSIFGLICPFVGLYYMKNHVKL